MTSRPWRAPVVVAQIPEQGLNLDLVADAATRAALAGVAGLREMSEAVASVTLTPAGAGKVRVTGRVRAVVGQVCVVTLDPVDNVVDETFDVLFVPDDRPVPGASSEDEEPPEPIANGTIDAGSLATDFLFLGIDPYPRRPGAVFAPDPAASDPEEHPFAALKAFKDAPPPETEQPAPKQRRAPRKGS